MSNETQPTLTPEQILEAFLEDRTNVNPYLDIIQSTPGFSLHPEWIYMTIEEVANDIEQRESTTQGIKNKV